MRNFIPKIIPILLLGLFSWGAHAQAPTAGQPLSSWGAAATAAGTDLIPTTQGGTLKKQTLSAVDIYIESLNLANLGSPSTARTNLGVPLGISGATLCLLNSNCGFSGNNTFSGTTTLNGTVSGSGITSLFGAPPSIGNVTPAAGAFTTLSASSTVSGSGFSTYLASPPGIGGTAPAAGAFTTLSATSTVSGTGFNNLFASPPAIGGTAAAAGSFTTLNASSTVTLSGLSAGTQVSCLGLNGSNQIVLNAAACGSGSGGTLTVQDTASHVVSAVTTLTFGAGGCVSGTSPSASMIPCSPDRTVGSGAVTFTTADWAGQVNNNVATNTATIPGTGTLGTGNTVIFTNQASTPVTITNSQTVNGLGLSTKLHTFGFYAYTGNGASADAWGFPGYDTITINTVPIFSDASGALTASEITDASAGGVVIGSPTGGQKGAGTLNMAGCYVNGTACAAGGSGTVGSGTAGQLAWYSSTGTAVVGNAGVTFSSVGGDALTVGVAGSAAGTAVLASLTSGGSLTLAYAGGSSATTATFPANTGTVAELNLAQSFTAAQTFPASGVKILGSSTGATILASALTGSSNSTWTVPITATDTFVGEGTANTFTASNTFGEVHNNTTTQSGTTYTLAGTDCGTMVQFTSSSAVTVTVPATLPVKCSIAMEQQGDSTAASLSITGSAVTPATLHKAFTNGTTRVQYSVIGITVESNSGGSSAVVVMWGDGA